MLRCLAAALVLAAAPLAAAPPPNPQIDYPGFRRLAGAVQPHRDSRLVDWAPSRSAPSPRSEVNPRT